jgi:CRP/FNR family transcriptional regulator, anaerobic regulatory protein
MNKQSSATEQGTAMEAPGPANASGFNLHHLRVACSTCNLRELCLPVGLKQDEIEHLDQAIFHRRQVKRGDHLFRAGMPFQSLYAVRNGFFKTYALQEDGREQVTGFHMMGEIMGLDAISVDAHTCGSVALEDSEVCEVPFDRLEELSQQMPTLQHHFHKMMSREIVRDHGVMLLLGSMRAEERLAAFLLNLSQRFKARGYSRTEFVLRMTREEIGNYLGLKLETVSRTLSKFQDQGIIAVQNKAVRIVDMDGLGKVIGTC